MNRVMNKLFQKAKLAVKFHRAGEGHTLNESSTSSKQNRPDPSVQERQEPSSDARKAGQAAIARFQQQDKQTRRPQSATTTWKSQTNQLKNHVRNEMKNEILCTSSSKTEKEVIKKDAAAVLAVSGVYFVCPFCFASYPRQHIRAHMAECLGKAYKTDPTLTPVNMIKSLNRDQRKIDACIDVLCRYLDNILKNPGEEKYRRIKQGNKIFQEKVKPVIGSTEFLLSCGFTEKPLPDDPNEMCFQLEGDSTLVVEKLTVMKDILVACEANRPKLDRSLKILRPIASSDEALDLPDDFFDLTTDEIKRMQTERSDEVERNAQLRTRAMREREATTRVYRFTLLRVKFPDGFILQGTFHAREKASSLKMFVKEQLQTDWMPFILSEPGGGQLTQDESSFEELGLVPAAILHFNWDPTILSDVQASGSSISSSYLKSELLNALEM
ncbi:UBX domain-containing protein 6-like [Xenia sp. Carnegie-2017]|uniref:UBX domain-containing protein 6-like n=1 Tax=Xenia sp. Carnegie-2017 TaxID=2897299 RepID=UPI001F047BC2|nr:UBX domain-containing protein 6-like [Xenia sp. Carnegie-2017]XP_046857647.1 UBX domain-containing protein 6-like [Xenia sp. Carnegie-2017]